MFASHRLVREPAFARGHPGKKRRQRRRQVESCEEVFFIAAEMRARRAENINIFRQHGGIGRTTTTSQLVSGAALMRWNSTFNFFVCLRHRLRVINVIISDYRLAHKKTETQLFPFISRSSISMTLLFRNYFGPKGNSTPRPPSAASIINTFSVLNFCRPEIFRCWLVMRHKMKNIV